MNQDLERRYLVVGVHGSAASYAALQWAAREAKLRETSLLVVRAWEDQAAAPYAPAPVSESGKRKAWRQPPGWSRRWRPRSARLPRFR